MQVICDRCNTEYDFDDALVSSGGTTVKCTNCGHLFKVFRARSSHPSLSGPGSCWIVEYASGGREELASLRELTRRISAGRLGAADRISRTGRAFRRVGEIPQLQEFLLHAPNQAAAKQRTAEHRFDDEPTEPDMAAHLLMEPSVPLHDLGDTSAPRRGPSRAPAVPRTRGFGERVLVGPSPTTTGARLDLDGLSRALRGGHARLWGSLALVLLLAAILAAVWWSGPRHADHDPNGNGTQFVGVEAAAGASQSPAAAERPQEKMAAEAARQAIETADGILARHDLRRFPDAARAYQSTAAYRANEPHVLSALARLYGRWSQALAFELQDLQLGLHPEPEPDREGLEAAQQVHARTARDYAMLAARKNPRNEEAEIALADAFRLANSLAASRDELDRTSPHGPDHAGEALRVAALLKAAQAGGNLQAAADLVRQAVAAPDCTVACEILWIRTQLAGRQLVEAEHSLNTLAQSQPALPAVTYLRALLERMRTRQRRQPTVQPTVPQDSSPLPQNAPASTSHSTTAAVADRPSARRSRFTSNGGSLQRDTVRSLCRRGELALENGDIEHAQALFVEAANFYPVAPRVETGLGFVALEKRDFNQALTHFRNARRKRFPEAYIGLGATYRAIERYDDALKVYREYLALFPRGRSTSIARQQLQALRLKQPAGRPGAPVRHLLEEGFESP